MGQPRVTFDRRHKSRGLSPHPIDGSSCDTLGGMCTAVTCKKCGKPTWKGCGKHVEMVLGDVPEADRCHCQPESSMSKLKGFFTR